MSLSDQFSSYPHVSEQLVMEANFTFPHRLSVHRRSKRLSRSTSQISPLARNLLRSLHEQKRQALAKQRALRWEQYSFLNQSDVDDPDTDDAEEVEHNETSEDDHSEDQVVPTCEEFPAALEETFIGSSEKYEVQSKVGNKIRSSIKFKSVKRQVSKVVSKMFLKRRCKRMDADASDCSTQLKSYRKIPTTVL